MSMKTNNKDHVEPVPLQSHVMWTIDYGWLLVTTISCGQTSWLDKSIQAFGRK